MLRMTAVSELMHRAPVSGASTRADSARPSRRTLRNLAALTRLARSVLCTAPVAFLSGCLLSDPPDLEQSERIGPIFNLAQATPVPTEVLHLDADQERQSFNLPFRSEDGPDGLQMLVYLDYRPGTLPFDSRFIQPSTFDQPRSLSYEWLIDVVPGCHSLTFILSAPSNFANLIPTAAAVDRGEVATATWWISYGNDPTDPITLAECPGSRVSAP